MIDIKTQYPKAYIKIKEQILTELNKSGKLSSEIMAAVPVDSIVQNSIGAAPRMMYDILDKEGIYISIHWTEDSGWNYGIGTLQGTEWYKCRTDAEVAAFTFALELLNSKK